MEYSLFSRASHVAQSVKHLPAIQETWVQFLGWLGSSPGEGNRNPLHYSCLANPMDRGASQATVHGITRAGHDLALSFFIFNVLLVSAVKLYIYIYETYTYIHSFLDLFPHIDHYRVLRSLLCFIVGPY